MSHIDDFFDSFERRPNGGYSWSIGGKDFHSVPWTSGVWQESSGILEDHPQQGEGFAVSSSRTDESAASVLYWVDSPNMEHAKAQAIRHYLLQEVDPSSFNTWVAENVRQYGNGAERHHEMAYDYVRSGAFERSRQDAPESVLDEREGRTAQFEQLPHDVLERRSEISYMQGRESFMPWTDWHHDRRTSWVPTVRGYEVEPVGSGLSQWHVSMESRIQQLDAVRSRVRDVRAEYPNIPLPDGGVRAVSDQVRYSQAKASQAPAPLKAERMEAAYGKNRSVESIKAERTDTASLSQGLDRLKAGMGARAPRDGAQKVSSVKRQRSYSSPVRPVERQHGGIQR